MKGARELDVPRFAGGRGIASSCRKRSLLEASEASIIPPPALWRCIIDPTQHHTLFFFFVAAGLSLAFPSCMHDFHPDLEKLGVFFFFFFGHKQKEMGSRCKWKRNRQGPMATLPLPKQNERTLSRSTSLLPTSMDVYALPHERPGFPLPTVPEFDGSTNAALD